ncbi:hypothetical protein B0H14DRAFT_2723520 [Mycena olivaceomarginata]|nr:hypothetical protein B0H14DRAFT_2723520 [Mycena olivaceomarginata]
MKHPRFELAFFALTSFVIDSGLHLRAARACESCYRLVHTLHMFVPTASHAIYPPFYSGHLLVNAHIPAHTGIWTI